MILADTSVWVEHLRRGDARLAGLLEQALVLMHPFIVGEIACGQLADRAALLQLLQGLPMACVATDEEVHMLLQRHRLHGSGIGWVDMHLLAAVRLSSGARLWARDKRLAAAAATLGVVFDPVAGS